MTREWIDEAACASVDPEVFFPTKRGGSIPVTDESLYAAAALVCGRCPVRDECEQDILPRERQSSGDRRYGYQAGMTPHERASKARRIARYGVGDPR